MQTNEIVKELIDKINGDLEVTGTFKALYAYDDKNITVPIEKTYIAFSTSENTVSFFDNSNKDCCKKTKVEIKANVYAPPIEKTVDTYTLTETLLDYLLIEYAGKMSGYTIDKVRINKDLKCFELPCSITFIYEQCPAYSGEGSAFKPFADFMCKTHVDDGNIHVTAEEKDYWLAPFVCGTFSGDGETEQKIFLGFKPKCLFVFGSGTAGIGFENDKHTCYFAFAINSKGTKGLSVESDGFTVKMSDTTVSKGTVAKMNVSGQTYNYIAFK